MTIATVLIWYILPFVLVTLIGPKCISAGLTHGRSNFHLCVKRKHFALAGVLGLIPGINTGIFLFFILCYIVEYDNFLSQYNWFNKCMFEKEKEKEKEKK